MKVTPMKEQMASCQVKLCHKGGYTKSTKLVGRTKYL